MCVFACACVHACVQACVRTWPTNLALRSKRLPNTGVDYGDLFLLTNHIYSSTVWLQLSWTLWMVGHGNSILGGQLCQHMSACPCYWVGTSNQEWLSLLSQWIPCQIPAGGLEMVGIQSVTSIFLECLSRDRCHCPSNADHLFSHLNKIAIQGKGPDGKWTRKTLAYQESNIFNLCVIRPPEICVNLVFKHIFTARSYTICR